MLKRVFWGLCAIAVAISFSFWTSLPVLAMDARSGETVTVATGEVVDDDLYVMARTVIVNGTVNGDVFGLAQTFIINGNVNGGVTIAGQTVNLSGDVGRGIRVAGQTVNLDGRVGGDLVAAGAAVNVGSKAEIVGDLVISAGDVDVNGPVRGDVKGNAGQMTISSAVGGNVEVSVENLTLKPTADISGNLTYTSENEAVIASGAKVGGETTHKVPEVKKSAKAGPFEKIGGKFLGLLMALVTGIVLILVAPRKSASIADLIRNRPLSSLGWGAIALFITPIAVVILCITVIGIPLALIALVLYAVAIYLSQIIVGLFLGRWIIGYFRGVESRAILVGALALGLAIVFILKLLPYLSFIVGLAIALFALGALVVWAKSLRASPYR